MAEGKKCNGCGKPIDNEDSTRIVRGRIREGSFKERKEFGLFHDGCFNRSFDHPDTVLDEMKRLARAAR